MEGITTRDMTLCIQTHTYNFVYFLQEVTVACTQARGPVENWLSGVESCMRATLRACCKRAMREYVATPRSTWALQQPAQLTLLVAGIYWCQVMTPDLNFGRIK